MVLIQGRALSYFVTSPALSVQLVDKMHMRDRSALTAFTKADSGLKVIQILIFWKKDSTKVVRDTQLLHEDSKPASMCPNL